MQTNLNAPRLVLAEKCTEADLDRAALWRRRFMPEADSASQILAHDPLEFCTGTCGKGLACDCTEYLAAVEFAEQVDEDERMGSDLQVGIWCLLGFAAIGLLWVLLR